MNIRQATKNEYADVLKHYEFCNYNAGIQDNDIVIIALEDRVIIGAVRICQENGEKVLRGMQVSSKYRYNGIGKAMLLFLKEHVKLNDCYCLPFIHLKNFYGRIGFQEIEINNAPPFLAERLKYYLQSGHDSMIIMKHF